MIMNSLKIKILAAFVTIGMLAGSCSESFLETNSSTDIDDGVVYNNVETAEGVLFGIYKYMRSWGGTDSGERADCCGLHTNLITFDVMGNDINMEPGSWYWYDYDYWHTCDEIVFKTYHFWEFYYTIINNCNNILFYIDDIPGDNELRKSVKGQALALRAMSYFHLIQLYQQPYSVAKDMPGVPIYLAPANAETLNNPRASVSKVYELILSDLGEAVKILGTERTSKYYINRNVAYGLLARVNLTMGDWSQADVNAALAMEGYPVMSAEEWTSGFNSNSISEWIWGVHQTSDQNVGWGSSFSFFDYERGNQKSMRISSDLYEKYSDSDIRKSLISKVGNLYGNLKFREPATLNLGHMVLMRASEMLLIRAEAKARQGNDKEAAELLYSLVSKRDPEYTRTTATGNALIEEILLERRKELWGEGFSLFDILRNRKGLERGGDHRSKKVIPAGSWKFIFAIPRLEIDVNEGISEEDQNPTQGIL